MSEGRTTTANEFLVCIRAYLTLHSTRTFEEINHLIAGRVNDQRRLARLNRAQCTKSRWMIIDGQLITDEPLSFEQLLEATA